MFFRKKKKETKPNINEVKLKLFLLKDGISSTRSHAEYLYKKNSASEVTEYLKQTCTYIIEKLEEIEDLLK